MRPLGWCAVMLAVVLAGCRDEQAGPRPKARSVGASPAVAKGLDAAPANLAFRSGATWAQGAVRYLGSSLEPRAPVPGQSVELAHYFVALRPPPQQFSFFVHIVDEAGQMVANADHELQGGSAPLGSWPVGRVIEDRHQFVMPQGQGRLRALLGFWQGDQRLPVDDPQAHDGSQRMWGPWLEAAQEKLPEYLVVRAEKAPVIDGVVGDEVWKKATPVELVGSFDGRRVSRRTVARMLYDDRFLYVSFECEDPDVWGTLMAHDDAIYNEEVVEIFLDADGDGRTYNELQVSPNNVTFDAAFTARRSDLEQAKAWESGMKTAVKVRGTVNADADRDESWSAEMQIELSKLMAVPQLPPVKGSQWRFNLYRLEHPVRRQRVEGQAFSPLFVDDFHHLPRFGRLVFQ